jgi:hypothetical protein
MPRQSWFDALQMFRLCATCGHVYHDNTPSVPGQQCPRCQTERAGPNPYFVTTISDIADLIAQFYPLPNLDVHPLVTPPPPSRANALAILVFFCTLGEILLQHFLERAMQKLDLPPEVQQRLLDDNLFTKQRVQKLFPALCGVKWKDAIKVVSSNSPDNFETTAKFFLETSEHRNRLLHLGNTWQPPSDIAKQCFEQIAPLIYLFVALHNTYLVRKL